MSHNPLDSELEFLISFLKSATKGDSKYTELIMPLLLGARELAEGKSIYEVNIESLNLKILIDSYAHDWLLKTDLAKITTGDFKELENIINENKGCVLV